MFKKVNPKQDFIKMEHEILDFWRKEKIFDKLRTKNHGKSRWSFLDGPITANNPMGVHHAWGRTLKDVFQRYKAMKGFDQRFQNGFDCQGLWVEVEVEKELGFKNKRDIEKYGVDRFVERCKERVRKYSKIQTEQSIRLGQWMDWENSYFTMSDENNYAIWHFLKKCWLDGNLYKGRDSVPWCPRCGTAISQHEILTEEYKLITHKAVFFKFQIPNSKFQTNSKFPQPQGRGRQISNDEDIYFLVWTTTPWTIPANVALAVNAKLKYGLYYNGRERLIMLKDLAEKVLSKDFKLEKEFLGKELKGLKYIGPFDDLARVKKAREENPEGFHKVIIDNDLVQADEGTGIVHVAPGAGEEDFRLGQKENLVVISVIDEGANYLENMGEFSGKNAKEHPEIIFDYLMTQKTQKLTQKTQKLMQNNAEDGNFLYKIEDYTHRYPTCWRCKKELVWRVVDEWYIAMDKVQNPKSKIQNKFKIQNSKTLREKMIGVAKKIKWMPEFGLEQELDWLQNMHDWLISKKRYWGLALPIYECECGSFEVIGSREELRQRAVEGWEEFEGHSPHKPWIDKVKIKCSKCGRAISRILDVGNPWLDAGIVPYSTMKYFSDKEFWKKWFPADFICESFPGQFKNWFYSLIAMSAVLEDINPFDRVLGYATVRDEHGEEMHKSKGNAIWFDDAAEKMGIDVMRWMYAGANPFKNLNFGYKIAEKVKRKLILLWNVYSFFVLYANIDKWNFKNSKFRIPNTPPDSLRDSKRASKQITNNKLQNKLDQWILSELNSLILAVNKELDNFNTMRAMEDMEKFLDNLANWYVRRSRRRFWKSENDEDKEQAYLTLYTVLVEFVKLLSPILPFVSEEIYRNLVISNQLLVISNSRSVHLCDYPVVEMDLIDEDLNKEMDLVRIIAKLGLAARAKAGIKVRQPLSKLKISAFVNTTADKQSEKLKVSEDLIEILKDEVNVKEIEFVEKIEYTEYTEKTQNTQQGRKKFFSKDNGWQIEGEGDVVVALRIELSEELELEGMAREIVRHIQSMRKKADYDIADRIKVYYKTDDKLRKVFEEFGNYIKRETLAKELIGEKKVDIDLGNNVKVNKEEIWLGLTRI